MLLCLKIFMNLYIPPSLSLHPPNTWSQPLGKGSAIIKSHWFTCGGTAAMAQSELNTNTADWQGIFGAVMVACGALHTHVSTVMHSHITLFIWEANSGKSFGIIWGLLWLAFLHNSPGLMGGCGGNWESQRVQCRRKEDKEIGEQDDALVES